MQYASWSNSCLLQLRHMTVRGRWSKSCVFSAGPQCAHVANRLLTASRDRGASMTGRAAGSSRVAGVIVIACMAAAAAFGARGLFGNEGQRQPTLQSIDRELSLTRIGKVMKERFPEDYQAMIEQALGRLTDKSKTRREIELSVAHLAASVRVKHGNNIAYAPSELLKQVLRTQVEVMRDVQAKFGAVECARMANLGIGATSVDTKSIRQTMDLAAEAIMMAIAEGRDAPVLRLPPEDEDYTPLTEAMLAQGVPAEAMESIGNEKPDDSDCAHFIIMMNAAVELPGTAGDRVRAAFAKDIASSM